MKKIFLVVIILLLTGCDSYIELNDLAIINSIGIEYQDNTYTFYANVTEEIDKETNKPKTTIYEVKGDSINEVIDNLSLTLSKKIYISHLDLLLINDTIKKNELKEIIHFFLNNNESREDFLVATSDDIKNVLENTDFKEINDLIENNQKQTSKSIYTTMYDVINNFYLNEKIYFTNITLDEHPVCSGLKVFTNNNYQFIEEDKVIFTNYLLNNIDTYKYSYKCSSNNYLYLNILAANVNELNNEIIIANEIKVIANDCNYKKEKINQIFNHYLKDNLKEFTNKKITIKNTIRGTYEN